MYTQGRTCISVMQTKCLTATVIVRGRQGNREGEKPQWCTPKTADKSSANSCYCQQLQCSFPFQRNTHGILHKNVSHVLTLLQHNDWSACESSEGKRQQYLFRSVFMHSHNISKLYLCPSYRQEKLKQES